MLSLCRCDGHAPGGASGDCVLLKRLLLSAFGADDRPRPILCPQAFQGPECELPANLQCACRCPQLLPLTRRPSPLLDGAPVASPRATDRGAVSYIFG